MNQLAVNSTHLSSGFATHPGRGRTVNEDSLGLPEGIPQATLARKGHLYVVADGVGGYQAGDVASQMAVEIIRRAYYEDLDADVAASLQRAIEAANAEIHRQARSPAYADMAATVVAAVLRGDELVVANVGDSRAYLLRGGRLRRLTADHTWVAQRVTAGILTPEEAAHHDMRHVVTRSLGDQPTVEADVHRYLFLPGDRLLLCTDGLWEPVSDPEMAHILGRGRPQAAANTLVNRAIAAGGADDATALLVEAQPVRAGMLGQVRQAVGVVLASPQQRAVVIGIGAVLALALFICGITRLLPGGAAQLLPTVTPAQVVLVSPTLTSTAPPATPTATTAPPTVTPTPIPTEAPTLVPPPIIDGRYCIVPSTNPQVGSDFPANAVDPGNCQQIPGMFIPVGADIWVPSENTYQDCGNLKIVEVAYGAQLYWIFPYRIGRRSADGTCQPIPDWRDLFGSARQP